MVWVLAAALGLLLYVYAGYPLALAVLVRLRGARAVTRRDIEPQVTLIVSAYNEGRVIAQKLTNALALDYPRGQLEVVVISDASTDGTDDVVRGFADRGVTLVRLERRLGKTAGLNAVVPRLAGEIVAFTDANAMFAPDALRKLVRNFADPAVGCVTGNARYVDGNGTPADAGERQYWSYEERLKTLESNLGSLVGGDGAISAIRTALWRPLPESAISDFLVPLGIVAAGWRSVYEPEAICYEPTAGAVGTEYRRRVRIVGRSWRALFQAPVVWNPARVGLFTWCLVSHKVLRWLSGVFAALALLAAPFVAAPLVDIAGRWWPLVALAGLAVPYTRRAIRLGGYAAVIWAASAVGVVKGSLGRVSGTWTPTRPSTGRPEEGLSPVVEARPGRVL